MSNSTGEALQQATTDYQKLATDTSTIVESRQKLSAQLTENTNVKKVRSVCSLLGA